MKLFLLLFLLGALILTPCSIAQRIAPHRRQDRAQAGMAKYIGLRYGLSLPDNLKILRSEPLSVANDVNENRVSEVQDGRVKMLWLERLTHRDGAGLPHWEVKDVVILPPLRKKEILAYSFCSLSKQPNREIIAVADYRPRVEYLAHVRRAWRANRRSEKFEEISPKGVKCENVIPMGPVLY